MAGRVVEVNLGWQSALGIDISLIVPVVSATTGRCTVTDVTTCRAEIEACTMGMAFGAVLIFVMAIGRLLPWKRVVE